MILITGGHKAFALYKAIEEGVNHMWTVSAFQQHPQTVFVCDDDATLELRVKTVKYFQGNIDLPYSYSTAGYSFVSHGNRINPGNKVMCRHMQRTEQTSGGCMSQIISKRVHTVYLKRQPELNVLTHVFTHLGMMHVHNMLVDPLPATLKRN